MHSVHIFQSLHDIYLEYREKISEERKVHIIINFSKIVVRKLMKNVEHEKI